MASKLVNLVAIATLAILASFGPQDVSALSVEGHHFVRHNPHQALARRAEQPKSTANRRRCRPRPSSSLVSSTATPAPSPSAPPPKPAPEAPPQQSPKPPPPAPQPAPPPPAPAPPPNNGGGKKGIAWNGRSASHLANFLKHPNTGFCYTWSPYRCAGVENFPHVQSLPMIWGEKHVNDARRLITSTAYAKWILGPNEPDHHNQANMNVGHAIEFWRTVMDPFGAQGFHLVAPAPTNSNDGWTWINGFMKGCTGCQIDATAAHWYGNNKQNFIDHVTRYRNTFGRRVFVTEFACQSFGAGPQCSWDQIFDFMRTVTNWMDGYEGVAAYFAFGVLDSMGNVNEANRLMDRNSGQPTDLGRVYLN